MNVIPFKLLFKSLLELVPQVREFLFDRDCWVSFSFLEHHYRHLQGLLSHIVYLGCWDRTGNLVLERGFQVTANASGYGQGSVVSMLMCVARIEITEGLGGLGISHC